MTLDKLNAYRKLICETDALYERITRLRSAMEPRAVSYSESGIRYYGGADRMAANMAKLDELEQQYTQRVGFLECELAELDEWLDTLPPNEANVIRIRYMKCLTWKQTTKTLGFESNKSCLRIVHRAMQG